MKLQPGDIFDERYEILSVLGGGGMGVVYKARHLELDKVVALKMLRSEQLNETTIGRFMREAQVLSSLKHPNIVEVYTVSQFNAQPYIAMEFVDGHSLSDEIKLHGGIDYRRALPWIMQVCDALGFAHDKGLVHRDIKPGNMLLCEKNGASRVKLADFGLARFLSETQSITKTGAIVGSVPYMAPELFNSPSATPCSDIYALGCTLFEMLSGAPAYSGETYYEIAQAHSNDEAPALELNDVPPGVSASLNVVLGRLLSKQPVERMQSCAELKGALLRILSGEEITASNFVASVKQRTEPMTASRLRVMLAAAAAIMVTVLACGVWYLSQVKSGPEMLLSVEDYVQRAQAHEDAGRYAEAAADIDVAYELAKRGTVRLNKITTAHDKGEIYLKWARENIDKHGVPTDSVHRARFEKAIDALESGRFAGDHALKDKPLPSEPERRRISLAYLRVCTKLCQNLNALKRSAKADALLVAIVNLTPMCGSELQDSDLKDAGFAVQRTVENAINRSETLDFVLQQVQHQAHFGGAYPRELTEQRVASNLGRIRVRFGPDAAKQAEAVYKTGLLNGEALSTP